jgi:cysteinyl-tRNA synthetase
MKEIGLVEPQFIAKATDYITDQLNLVRKLKIKGFTYQIDDGIYFDTSKFPTYADFAHLDLAAQKAGARTEYNPQKRNPSDFALWKFTPSDQKRDMEWETPIDLLDDGKSQMGFPGWHLECSAISMAILGETLDIHTGGIDHIPVHHTNEIAQSEAVTGKRFSNYWLHNNFLKVDGTKISKSLGNGYTLRDLKEKGFSPLDFRMFILQGHYRSEGNFTFDGLTSAKNRLQNWRNMAALRHQTHDTLQNDEEKSTSDKSVSLYTTSQAVAEAIGDDLSTPEALKIIDETFTQLGSYQNLAEMDRIAFISLLETIDNLLGLKLLETTPDISDEAKQLIIQRNSVRINKDWEMADKLRNQLLLLGIILRDSDENSIWEYKY